MTVNISIRLLIIVIVTEIITATPHIPQVVYPTKDRTRNPFADGISRGKTTTKNAGSTLMSKAAQSPLKQLDSPEQLDSSNQHQSGYIAVTNDTKSINESRIVLAPIDGEKVYTLDRYLVTSSERVVEPKHSSRPRTALAAVKTQTQLSRGISLVNEVVSPDLKRTTMSEATTTPKPKTSTQQPTNTSSSTYKPIQAIQTSQKSNITRSESSTNQSKNSALALKNVRLVSHDTSSGRASSEIKYPAKKWQIPLELYYARQKSYFKDVETNSVGNSAAEQEDQTSDNSYEEALELYMKTKGIANDTKSIQNVKHVKLLSRSNSSNYLQKQKLISVTKSQGSVGRADSEISQPLTPMQSLQHVAKSIDDVIEKAFGEKKSKPKMVYVNGDHKNHKFRATFATHHGENPIVPLQNAQFPDETDMDLLVENTRRPTQAAHRNTNTLHRPIPIHQPQTPVVAHTALDPNHKLDLCCRKQQVSAVCQNMCNFDTFNDRSLISAVLSNQCAGPQLGQAFDCASSKADHTDCCTRNNLHLYAGGQCMPFCQTHRPTPPNLISYIACLQVFDTIKNCYREYSYTHPNIFGD